MGTCGEFVLNMLLVSSWNYHPCCVPLHWDRHLIACLQLCKTARISEFDFSFISYASEISYVLCGTGVYSRSIGYKLETQETFYSYESTEFKVISN